MKQTPANQDKPTPDLFEPSSALDWLCVLSAFLVGWFLGSAFVATSEVRHLDMHLVSAGVADRAVGGEAARGAGGRAGAPLGNHGEMNSVVAK